jgi:hypothetical protein
MKFRTVTDEELDIAVEEHGTWLTSEGKSGKRLELREADLSYRSLSFKRLASADFAGSDLHGTTFVGAALNNVSFREASLYWADLTNAILFGSNFAHCDLRNATLRGMAMIDLIRESGWYGAKINIWTVRHSGWHGDELKRLQSHGVEFCDDEKLPPALEKSDGPRPDYAAQKKLRDGHTAAGLAREFAEGRHGVDICALCRRDGLLALLIFEALPENLRGHFVAMVDEAGDAFGF